MIGNIRKDNQAVDFTVFVRLMGFAKKYRLQFYIAAFSTMALSIVASAFPYVLIYAIDDFSVAKNSQELLCNTLILMSLLLVQVILQFSFIYFANWLGQHIVRNIRQLTFAKVLGLSVKYFNYNSVGRLVTRVVSDIENIANFFSQGVFTIISDLLKMVVVIFVMFYVNWRLTLIALSILPVLIVATRLFQKSIKNTFQEARNQVSNLNSFVQERVSGMRIVQLFNREEIEFKKFKEINQRFKEANIRTVWYYSIFFPIAELLSSIAVGLIVWYGALQVLDNESVKLGQIIGFISMTQMLFRPLRQIADKFNQLQMGIVCAERVFKVIDTDDTIGSVGNISANNIKGDIAFNDVEFSYSKGEKVLKKVSFNVMQGQTVAIVGATGAGKSTIINLLSRFYEYDKGIITIDGVDIRDYDLKQMRKKISVVLQDVFLFSDTILNNITLSDPSITELMVIDAAKEIGVHDFIMSLPNGYAYMVKEGGAMLSSGQRQLIAFLRAYLSDPSIFILDEATSLVDSGSEKMMQYATDRLTINRTAIIIAHRISTISEADIILVLDNGELVEQGVHNDLITNCTGYYYKLFQKQFMTK